MEMETETSLLTPRTLRKLTWLPVLLVGGAVIVLVTHYVHTWLIIAVLESIFLVGLSLLTTGGIIYLLYNVIIRPEFFVAREKSHGRARQED